MYSLDNRINNNIVSFVFLGLKERTGKLTVSVTLANNLPQCLVFGVDTAGLYK